MFKHAFDKNTLQPEISIAVRLDADEFIYTIADNGKGLGGKTLDDLLSKPDSKGMKIVTAQLKKFYAGRSTLLLVEAASPGTEWEIRVPVDE